MDKKKETKKSVSEKKKAVSEIKEATPVTNTLEPKKELSKGILLVAYGDKSYGGWAFNMAISIRHFNPHIPIHLVATEQTIKDIDLWPFTSMDLNPDLPFKMDGKIDVAGAKTLLYDLSPYDQTIYLDVDGVCLSDIESYFERIFSGHQVFYQGMGQGGKQDVISYMWLLSNQITWDHFSLPEDAIFTTSQTSFVAFDKSETSAEFFARLKRNYATNKAAANQFAITWGPAAHQPDELYYSGTAAQLGIVPDMSIQPVFFPREHVPPQNIGKDVTEKYLILSMWGARNLVRPWAKDYYDRLMNKYLSAFHTPHIFKAHRLYERKFSGRK